jgi:hypothetical protein
MGAPAHLPLAQNNVGAPQPLQTEADWTPNAV